MSKTFAVICLSHRDTDKGSSRCNVHHYREELLEGTESCLFIYIFSCLCQLIVEISSMSAESLSFCANSGILSQLLDELTGPDVLVR